MRGIDKLVSYMMGLDVRLGRPVVPMKEQLFLERIMNSETASILGLIINGLYMSKSRNYPPDMIVSDADEGIKRKHPSRTQGSGLKNMVSDLFGKAKDGLNGFLADDDASLN